MGDPQTTAFTGVIQQGFGAIGSAVGAEYKAKGQKAYYKGEAAIAEINAKMAESTAQSALLSGVREQQKIMMNTANMKASQRTAFAAHGIDSSGGGTPINVLNSTEVMGQIDKNTAAANAVREAWGYRQQGAGFRGQAIVDRATASAISPSSAFMSSLMTGASQVNQSWNRYQLNYGDTGAQPAAGGGMTDSQWNTFLLNN